MLTRCLLGLLLLSALAGAMSGCGNDKTLVPPRPTITPTPVTPVAGDGPFLQPLTGGQNVSPSDGRYAFNVPADWGSIQAPPAEVAYAQPGSTNAQNAVTINLVRESLAKKGIADARAYAEAARASIGDTYQDVLPLTFGPVQVGTHGAYRWTYTATTANQPHYIYQLFVIDGGEGFVLTGVAPIGADQRATQALFDSIAGSLTFVRG